MNQKKRLRQGYFYTLDVVFAIVILMVGLLIVFGMYFYTPHKVKAEGITTDITGVLANIKLNDICSDIDNCDCRYESIKALCEEDPTQIKNPQISLLEFFGQLYHDNRRDQIEVILNETIIDSRILPPGYEMQVLLYDPYNPSQIEQLYPIVEAP